MKRRELKLIGLSYSQSQVGSYVAILADLETNLKLPVIIKPLEAQKIAMELDRINIPVPNIYDLVINLSDSFNINLNEIYIHSLMEGKFYTRLIFSDQVDDAELDSSVGDALALAIMYGSPIYASLDVLKKAGVFINDDGTVLQKSDMNKDKLDFLEELEKESKSDRIVSIENLEKMIEDAIANEEYEIAAELRDKINELK
jgi:bifunctional DNase/RNase